MSEPQQTERDILLQDIANAFSRTHLGATGVIDGGAATTVKITAVGTRDGERPVLEVSYALSDGKNAKVFPRNFSFNGKGYLVEYQFEPAAEVAAVVAAPTPAEPIPDTEVEAPQEINGDLVEESPVSP